MARDDHKKHDEDEEKEDADAGVSDDALDFVDEDEEDDPLMAGEPEDDKGWE
jgi:hypothetical protein